jgi:toxin ParE1/3/4
MPGFKLTPDALNDMLDIARYTEHQWGKKQRDYYLEEIDKRFHWLSENPDLAMPRDDIKPGYLSYPQNKHVIFFRTRSSHIEILGILHKSMDVKKHL